MFRLEIEGLKEIENLLIEQSKKRKTWRPKFERFIERELFYLGELTSLYAERIAPFKTGTLRSRISFKVPRWNAMTLFVDEPRDDQYALPVHDGFTHYKSGRWIKGRFFFTKAKKRFFPDMLIAAMKKHWKQHWNK